MIRRLLIAWGLPQDKATWTKVSVLMTLMMAHDLPNTLTGTLIPTVFTRSLGMPLEYIGLFSLPFIVSALKWTWAPMVDKYGSDRIGWRKSWLIPTSLCVAACFIMMGVIEPSLDVLFLIVALLVIKQVFYSTYEVAGDAYIVENLNEKERGFASSLIWLGREFGQFVGFAGLLVIFDIYGWRVAFFSAAGLYLLFNLPVLLRPEPKVENRAVKQGSPLIYFRQFFSRHHNIRILIVVFTVSFAVQMPVAIIGPFLSDQGLSLSEIGLVIGIAAGLGAISSLLIATPIISRLGAKRMGKLMLFIAPLAIPGFLWIVNAPPEDINPIVVAFIIFIGALCTAPIRMIVYAARIGWTSDEFVGSDFTLQQSTWFLGVLASAAAAGLIAGILGWFWFFIINMVMQVLAIALFVGLHDSIEASIKQARLEAEQQ